MTTDRQLEAYLGALDKALTQIPVSDRAEIVTEIKSHVLDTHEKHPEKSLAAVIAAIGEAEAVANRYLIERGLKPGKPPRSPMIKWLTIGFLGTFGLIILSTLVLIWKFTPIIKIDGESETIEILGGMIAIDGENETVRLGMREFVDRDDDDEQISGEREIAPGKFSKVHIPFSNAKLDIAFRDDHKLRYKCRMQPVADLLLVNEAEGELILQLDKSGASKCRLSLPRELSLSLKGGNAKIEIEKPGAAVDLEMINGKVEIVPDEQFVYRYDLKVVNGSVDHEFRSSDDSKAIPIRISMVNGVVSKEE